MDNTSVVAYFDGVAASYDQVLPFFETFASEAVRLIDPTPGTKTLDLAAGRGAFTHALLARGCAVTAVDGAPGMIGRLDHPDAHVMDAAGLTFPDDTFDLVVCGFAIHIVEDPVRTFAEAVRVTRPGGTLAFTVPGRADDGPDPWGPDPVLALFAEYRRFHADGVGRHGNDADLDWTGLTGVTATTLEVAIPVPDAATYWDWVRSHGSGRFVDGLPPSRRDELRSRLLASFPDDFVLRRSATLWTATLPAEI